MCRFWFRGIVMVAAVCFAGEAAKASISALQQSVQVDRAAGVATFTLFFDHPPDFQNIDEHGHVSDSFQVEVNGAWQPGENPTGAVTAVVRGDEIHFNDELPIRSAAAADPSPRSGGWGPIIDTVPFTLAGNELVFTASLRTLGSPSGVFAYRAFTMEHGQIMAEAQAQTVPLPAAAVAGVPMLLALAALSLRKKAGTAGRPRSSTAQTA